MDKLFDSKKIVIKDNIEVVLRNVYSIDATEHVYVGDLEVKTTEGTPLIILNNLVMWLETTLSTDKEYYLYKAEVMEYSLNFYLDTNRTTLHKLDIQTIEIKRTIVGMLLNFI